MYPPIVASARRSTRAGTGASSRFPFWNSSCIASRCSPGKIRNRSRVSRGAPSKYSALGSGTVLRPPSHRTKLTGPITRSAPESRERRHDRERGVVLHETVEDLLRDGQAVDVADPSRVESLRVVAQRPSVDRAGSSRIPILGAQG